MLTVLMISHMCLSLKVNNSLAQEEDNESYDLGVCSLAESVEVHQMSVSLDAWDSRQRTMSSIVGNLGNDLVHTSMLDY